MGKLWVPSPPSGRAVSRGARGEHMHGITLGSRACKCIAHSPHADPGGPPGPPGLLAPPSRSSPPIYVCIYYMVSRGGEGGPVQMLRTKWEEMTYHIPGHFGSSIS